ncbi:Hypothetical_protein [Hexamita inflata]|uniref:Hypothetical_protein n=1 Tax=Hexamita inflata TaxID=28002 RepID=A0ABP1HVT7_9EUKA
MSQFSQIDDYVAEYLTFRGFHDLSAQFKQASKQPDLFQDVAQTTSQLFQLSKSGQFEALQKLFLQFYDTFIRQNRSLQQAGQQVQIELYKLCLYQLINKKQLFSDLAKLLNKQFPGEFENFAKEGNVKKDECVNCYEQEIVQSQIECQLTNLVTYAFSNRRLPQLYGIIGQDVERISMLSEIMSLRNRIQYLNKKVEGK